MEMWAGVECTINRVGNRFTNQCDKSGHTERLEDLKLFADLGIHKIRYPFLWENLKNNDWSWFDARARELKKLKLTPIAGLLHHGSGPSGTNLLDESFPEKFVDYAKKFAERYPWIDYYTPINEPLTTARFSGLYGFWYPHAQNDTVFVRMLYLQIKAIILAMKAIREINPHAQLVQTEDLGYAQSTEPLRYQADFENARRWLSFDLLTGKVSRFHFLYQYLRDNGISEDELEWIKNENCDPNIIGINHYHLSNRFLDHRLELYPSFLHGGNGRDRYVDIGAVDSPHVMPPSPYEIFLEAQKRYELPIAVTEVHLNGPRENQMRWLKEVWESAAKLNLEAVTAWSLLGTYDWNTLCTKNSDFYESGVFDVRSETPRPTALVPMLKALAKKSEYEHPLLSTKGWWRREKIENKSETILITGATGTLGRAFGRICEWRGIPYRLVNRAEMDIADFDSVQKLFAQTKPWAVINTAGFVDVDAAEKDPQRCFRENVTGPANLAKICNDRKIKFLSFSSDLVFDGKLNSPYLENHPVAPLNVYGQSKAEAEKKILELYDESLIVRTSAFFGPWDNVNFITRSLLQLTNNQNVLAASDVTISPTYLPDLVHTTLNLLIDGETGILHLTNAGQVTWAQFLSLAAKICGKNRDLIRACAFEELKLPARRPFYSALDTRRARILPPFQEALERYFIDGGKV
jgi:dTDP-4-dehydrorhamnose reductase